MSAASTTIAVPNCILFINSVSRPDIPEITRGPAIWSTSSCIAVSCMPDCDGDTTITIGPLQDVERGEEPAFDGILATPTRIVLVEIVPGITILEQKVPKHWSRVCIWTNRKLTPDEVIIGLE